MKQEWSQYLSVREAVSKLLVDKNELDICDYYDGRIGGIGYNELRFCSIDKNGELAFESNNIHNHNQDVDSYKIFYWNELTDYEKDMLCLLFCKTYHKV